MRSDIYIKNFELVTHNCIKQVACKNGHCNENESSQ